MAMAHSLSGAGHMRQPSKDKLEATRDSRCTPAREKTPRGRPPVQHLSELGAAYSLECGGEWRRIQTPDALRGATGKEQSVPIVEHLQALNSCCTPIAGLALLSDAAGPGEDVWPGPRHPGRPRSLTAGVALAISTMHHGAIGLPASRSVTMPSRFFLFTGSGACSSALRACSSACFESPLAA